jgi:hypothetical protein
MIAAVHCRADKFLPRIDWRVRRAIEIVSAR